MQDLLGTERNFKSLSIRDLLDARDQYHYHLMNRANVVGTAIGLYLIRKDDPYPNDKRPRGKKSNHAPRRDKSERTFSNSEVRRYSWPCVLVLVNEWLKESDFGTHRGKVSPDQLVPRTLYLPDGRSVPVCVVKVEQARPSGQLVPDWHWPDSMFGAGMPITVRSQGREYRATAGCLVSDGHTTYALTSRHVCGHAGDPVFTIAGGNEQQIGTASDDNLTRELFSSIYPEFSGQRTYVNLDVGLIELDDVNCWTSNVFGLGAPGALADLNALNISLRLINAPVLAAGAASGRLEGLIKALFYRYKSVGGYDYISDFLIAPRDPKRGENRSQIHQTQPGDSGAVWHLVMQPRPKNNLDDRDEDERPPADPYKGILRPLAIQWGGQVFVDQAPASGTQHFTFALASSLTTVCSRLNVELVLERDTGVRPYWGQTGHYSIAAFAIGKLSSGKLKSFFDLNAGKLSFTIGKLSPDEIADALKAAVEQGDMIPLADVPDIVWKKFKTNPGGRDTQSFQSRTTGPEHPTHYADIDEQDSGGNTLRALCLADDKYVDPQKWLTFYKNAGHDENDKRAWGMLPFRVWQFFDQMVEFASKGQAAKFLCAAGLLSHYVGDACQPLHGSIYADGYKDQKTIVQHKRRITGEIYTTTSHVGAGVHSCYETAMIDRFADLILQGIPGASVSGTVAAITSGKAAATAIIELMDRSATSIDPKTLVESFLQAGGKNNKAAQEALWTKYGTRTIGVMADGARVLARIWQGAWNAGNGDSIAASKRKSIPPSQLIGYYNDVKFVESFYLDDIIGKLN